MVLMEVLKKKNKKHFGTFIFKSVYNHRVFCIPEIASLGQLLGKTFRSCRGTRTPSMLPNMDDRPRQKSMMKNRTDQRGDSGILVMASVNTMKARPVPSTPCESVKTTGLFQAHSYCITCWDE